jgi:hypothetical protein
MTNHPEAALMALEDWRSRAATDRDWDRGREVDLLSWIIDQLEEAAPSPPDSSQGEPVAWNIEVVPVVVRDVSDAHYVRLSIGCQHFNIGPDYLDTRADAEWFKTQLDTALRRAKPTEPVEADHVDVWARHQVASLRYWLEMSVARFAAKASVCELNNDEMQTLAEARSALAAFLYTPSVNSTMPPQDEPIFTASMYGTAAEATKAREEWLAAKGEPQARHWREALDEFREQEYFTTQIAEEIEQRARSLAQAEQAQQIHRSSTSIDGVPSAPVGTVETGK